MLTSLQSQLGLGLADNTLQSQDNLLGGLSLLVENWLGLTTVTALLTVVSSLTLGKQGSLTSLVLGDLVLGVLLAVLALAVGSSGFWDVNWKVSIGIVGGRLISKDSELSFGKSHRERNSMARYGHCSLGMGAFSNFSLFRGVVQHSRKLW